MVLQVDSAWYMQPVEIPVRFSGKRASARSSYVACKGCSEFIEVAPKTADSAQIGDVDVLGNGDHWHDECFNEYSEREMDASEMSDAAVDEAGREILENGIVTH